MPVIVLPYIPSTITVHLGLPDQWAENVTVSFPDYVKNVASSEIYPTWELSAIRANVLAIIPLPEPGLYRVLPQPGLQLQITNTTAYDQKSFGKELLPEHQRSGGRDLQRLHPPSGLCGAPLRQVLQRDHLHL